MLKIRNMLKFSNFDMRDYRSPMFCTDGRRGGAIDAPLTARIRYPCEFGESRTCRFSLRMRELPSRVVEAERHTESSALDARGWLPTRAWEDRAEVGRGAIRGVIPLMLCGLESNPRLGPVVRDRGGARRLWLWGRRVSGRGQRLLWGTAFLGRPLASSSIDQSGSWPIAINQSRPTLERLATSGFRESIPLWL